MQLITGKRPKVTVNRYKHVSTVHEIVFSAVYNSHKEILDDVEKIKNIPSNANRVTVFNKDLSVYETDWTWYVIEVVD